MKLITIVVLTLSLFLAKARLLRNRQLQAQDSSVRLLVTYRDFLPSSCTVDLANAAAPADVREAGVRLTEEQRELLNVVRNTDGGLCNLLTANAQWQQFLANEIVKGHPDFNIFSQVGGSQLCVGQDFFPDGTCRFAGGFPDNHAILLLELEENTAGIPKPVYCRPEAIDTCGVQLNDRQQTSQKQFFDKWFNDDLQFNKRIAQPLDLQRDANNPNLFFFATGGNDSPDRGNDVTPNFFGPLGRFKIPGTPDFIGINDFDDPRDFPAWPRAFSNDRGFWMTTEVHTTFEYFEDQQMVFRFSGDDDYWAFFNGQMAIDLQGIHGAVSAQIDLNGFIGGNKVADLLGLVSGNSYTLDIFHAERNVVGSNFDITTSLVPACNVIQSGEIAFDFSQGISENGFLELFFFSEGVTRINERSFELFATEPAGEFIFNAFGENFVNGFRSTFTARVAPGSEGFAFLVQNRGLREYPLTTGTTFNIEGVANSYAIVFDFCTNRNDVNFDGNCIGQDVRIHHADTFGEFNSANDDTKRVFDEVIRSNGRKFQEFKVEVIFFGESPDFVEVYIDDSLFLREKDVSILDIIGNGPAYMGFAASFGEEGGNIQITDFDLSTIVVDPQNSVFSLKADSLFRANDRVEFDLQTFDFCGNLVTAGGEAEFFTSFFVEVPNKDTGFYAFDRVSPDIQEGTVIDNVDGTYDVDFLTKFPGNFTVFVAFGFDCDLDLETSVNGDGVEIADVQFIGEPSECLFFSQDLFLETPAPTTSPTVSPTLNPTSNPTLLPTISPTFNPTINPTTNPTFNPTFSPNTNPTFNPTFSPTFNPTFSPSTNPTFNPTFSPTTNPTFNPTFSPTFSPTKSPTFEEELDLIEEYLPLLGLMVLVILICCLVILLCRCWASKRPEDDDEDMDISILKAKEDVL